MRRPAWLAFVLAVPILFVGCKGNFSKETSAGEGRIFRYSMVTNPTHVDPALVQDGDTIDITQQIFEGLVMWGEDNQVHPNLADSWDISPDGTTYTFHIKHGVKFSNGDPLTANDFKWSIERSCTETPHFNSETAEEYMGDIVGVSDMVHGKATSVSGVKVLDDYTLQIKIDKPRPYFVAKLTYPCSFAVDPKAVKQNEEMLTTDQMIGTGPFIATKYVEDQTFNMAANKNYHGGAPLIDGIERPILKDATTRLNKFKAGEVDLVQLERQDVAALQADPVYKSQLHFYRRPATWYLAFNEHVYPPFANKLVRQAFGMAINNKEIVDKTLGGINEIADGILPPSCLGHRTDAKILPFDPKKAKQLLAEAGYPDGSQMPALDLYFRTDREDVKLVAEAVQDFLRTNLNVTVTLKPLDWTTYLQKYNKMELPFLHMRWGADYLDPQNFLSNFFTSTGAENKTYYHNAEVDKLCGEADVMPEKDPKRLALYAQAEDIILQDVGWFPIYFQRDVELINPRVKGLRESVFGHLPHTTVSLDNSASATNGK